MKALFFLCTILWPLFSFAAVPTWHIVSDKSELNFTATQNGSPVTGTFKAFGGTIGFAPDQLAASHVNIAIDIGSVTTSYGEVADTLKTPDWFDVKLFPQAIFKAEHFTQTGENTYQAQGELTIRDKTHPVVLTFALTQYTPTQALVKGSTTLQRTAFGVGRGDWASTGEVKDDVVVNFTLTATGK